MKITKAKEKELLNELWSADGYFADSFKSTDLLIMLNNINNDFPLLLGTSREEKQADTLKQLNEVRHTLRAVRDEAKGRLTTIKMLEEDNKEMNEKNILILNYLMNNNLEEAALDLFTANEVIKYKVRHGMELTEKQKQIVVDTINMFH